MDLEHTSIQSDVLDPSAPKTSAGSSSPNEHVVASHAETDSSSENFVCYYCRRVEWDRLPTLFESFDMGYSTRASILRAITANHTQLTTSSCKMCRILSVVKPQYLDNIECNVEAKPFQFFKLYSQHHTWRRTTITALWVGPNHPSRIELMRDSRCLVAMSRRDCVDLSSRMTSPRLIDYGWLKSLAQSCEMGHKEYCRSGSLDSVSVPGLKVIEVSSRAIIEAPPDCRYVALSYVWGEEPNGRLEPDLQHPPRVIEDAISVTVAMDHEYLWIDKYVSL